MTAPVSDFRCGHVTLAGQPNVGKSTLLNRLVGEKLAIMSPKPQTTRLPLRGIWTGPDMQVVWVDTPGIHAARSPLNRAMVGFAIEALEQVDVVVWVIDAVKAAQWAAKHPAEPLQPGDRRVLADIRRHTDRWIVALNKVDAVAKPKLLPVMGRWARWRAWAPSCR